MQILELTAVLFGLALLLTWLLQHRSSSGLCKVPNAHFTAPFSRIWLLSIKWRGWENRTRLRLHRQLGPVIRIGPREVSVDCIEGGVQLIYGREFAKDSWYANAFYGNEPSFMFTMAKHNDHTQRRRMLSAMYSKPFILGSQMLDKHIANGLGNLRTAMASWSDGQSIDVLAQMRACMMDITSPWLYGSTNGTNWVYDGAARDAFLATYRQTHGGFFWRSEFPRVFATLQALGLPLISNSTRAAIKEIKRWSMEMTAKAFGPSNGGPLSAPTAASVYSYLRANFVSTNPATCREEVETIVAAELLDHAIASHDVCGISLSYIMYELSSNLKWQDRLRTELGTLSCKQSDERSLSQRIDELPLLDAIIIETLRLRSPSPGPKPRIVPSMGCRIAGRFDIPAGTVVSSSSWTLHRNPDTFPSPEDWLPERWLTADEADKKEMRTWFWAFGGGTRMCIGNHFAIRAMKAILVAVYIDFETSLLNNDRLEQLDAPKSAPVHGRVDLKFRRHIEPFI